MIKGSYLILRGLEVEDLDLIHEWMNNFDFMKMILRIKPSVKYFTSIWYEDIYNDKSKLIFAIEDIKTREFIGCIGVNNINYIDRNAEYYIYIGNKQFEGKGYAYEATKMFLEYLFNYLNMHKIYLNVRKDNSKAISLYKKAGFNIEGVLLDERYIEGKYIDILRMAIMKGDFRYEKINNITV